MEFAKAIAWISTAVAVIIGMKITDVYKRQVIMFMIDIY